MDFFITQKQLEQYNITQKTYMFNLFRILVLLQQYYTNSIATHTWPYAQCHI